MTAMPPISESAPRPAPIGSSAHLTTDGTLVDVYRRSDGSYWLVVTAPGAPRTLAHAQTIECSAEAARSIVVAVIDLERLETITEGEPDAHP